MVYTAVLLLLLPTKNQGWLFSGNTKKKGAKIAVVLFISLFSSCSVISILRADSCIRQCIFRYCGHLF